MGNDLLLGPILPSPCVDLQVPCRFPKRTQMKRSCCPPLPSPVSQQPQGEDAGGFRAASREPVPHCAQLVVGAGLWWALLTAGASG